MRVDIICLTCGKATSASCLCRNRQQNCLLQLQSFVKVVFVEVNFALDTIYTWIDDHIGTSGFARSFRCSLVHDYCNGVTPLSRYR